MGQRGFIVENILLFFQKAKYHQESVCVGGWVGGGGGGVRGGVSGDGVGGHQDGMRDISQ